MRAVHPAAELFPLMEGDEFAALVEDIRVNGQREPVWIDKAGRILDGRNRARACQELGLIPNTQQWDGTGSPVEFVLSLNLHRRHLSPSQKGVVALKIEKFEAAEAKKRQGRRTDLQQPTSGQSCPEVAEPEPTRARDLAAKAVGVSPRLVQDAKQVERDAPDLLPQVESGALSLSEAKKAIRQQEKAARVAELQKQEPAPLDAEGTFAVVYADPPWRYEHAEPTRAVENNYPTMSLDEIKALDVPADDDSVLFLWATSPKLAEAMEVLDAWGFGYRTSLVWVKDKIGMGYYARQRHEFLLIGARGSLPVPDAEDRPDSVIEAPRGEHSEKPEQVYALIERMYPFARRVELFARGSRDGWAAWGNQAGAAA